MTSRSSSTASLISQTTASSHPKSEPKDFGAAFSSLQSIYGFGGTTPSPVPKSTKGRGDQPRFAGPATTLKGEVTEAKPKETTKDYGGALAELQSSFSLNGSAPTTIPSNSKSEPAIKSLFTRLVRPSSKPTKQQPKDAEHIS